MSESGTRGGAAVAGVAAVKGGSIHEEEITKLYVIITWKMDIYIFFEKWTSNFEMSDCFKLRFIFL